MLREIILVFFLTKLCGSIFVNPHSYQKISQDQSENLKNWKVGYVNKPVQDKEYHVYPTYEFDYGVSDQQTGDHKYHYESRDGDKVRGYYGLIEPDGSVRNVHYDANDQNGFNAVITKSAFKHGESAFSTFGHTRRFSPFGQGVNINKYFPGILYNPKYDVNDKVETEVNSGSSKTDTLDKDVTEKDINNETIPIIVQDINNTFDNFAMNEDIENTTNTVMKPIGPVKAESELISKMQELMEMLLKATNNHKEEHLKLETNRSTTYTENKRKSTPESKIEVNNAIMEKLQNIDSSVSPSYYSPRKMYYRYT